MRIISSLFTVILHICRNTSSLRINSRFWSSKPLIFIHILIWNMKPLTIFKPNYLRIRRYSRRVFILLQKIIILTLSFALLWYNLDILDPHMNLRELFLDRWILMIFNRITETIILNIFTFFEKFLFIESA